MIDICDGSGNTELVVGFPRQTQLEHSHRGYAAERSRCAVPT
jgi:hypothetical protein